MTVLRVLDLGMPLDAVHSALGTRERGDRCRGRRCEYVETFRRTRHRVAVTHPRGLRSGLAREQHSAVPVDQDLGRAVFALSRVRDLTTERLRHDLESVADAERGDPEREDRRVEIRGTFFVNARRSAGQDDRRRALRGDIRCRHRVRHDLGVNSRFPNAARDQLSVLSPEVHDQNRSCEVPHRDCRVEFTTLDRARRND